MYIITKKEAAIEQPLSKYTSLILFRTMQFYILNYRY